jgi:hypothetical protein
MRSPSRRFRTAAAFGVAATLALALSPAHALTSSLEADLEPELEPVTDLLDPDLELDYAPQLVTVHTPTRAAKDRLGALGLDLTEHAGRDYVEAVIHTAEDEALLLLHGFTWDVRIADMLARELERIELDEAFAASVTVSDLPSGRTGYRVLEDFGREIDELVARFPGLAKRISIGTSVEGRDLTGIEIGRDVDAPEDGRPVFLMFGAHHAREWPSAELPMEFAYDLLAGYGTDARITDLLDRGRAIIVPVSNPDGYDASRTSGSLVDLREVDGGGTVSILATPGNAYKRKNCRIVDGETQPEGACLLLSSPGGLGVGVDLNRNYGALWGGPGASGDPTSAIYRGPAPFSEPETQAIRELISRRQVTTLITNHTFSNLILRPVGVHPDTIGPDGNPVGYAPDECFTAADGRDRGMQTLGERMAAHTGYSNQFGWELYDTTGTTEDYSYNATGGYGYTFEIGPDEFHPPFAEVVAEYTGDNDAARSVTPDNAHALTTAAADDCAGDPHDHDHDGVGGGNREAFLVAFENAIDAATHSVISGLAPAGATLTVERTGVFPLWDGSLVADTVATAMVTDTEGRFGYHVNPSTRPFVQSRKAPLLGAEKERLDETGVLAPLSSTSTTFEVTEPADLIRATVRTAVPVDGQVVSYAQFHLRLVAPDGSTVAQATEFGPINSLAWTGPDGTGIPTGTYTLQISNSIAVTSAYELEAATQDVLADHTARQFEQWTVSCLTADGLVGQVGASVERGQTVDVGDVCAAGLSDGGTGGKKPKKDPPGQGGGRG